MLHIYSEISFIDMLNAIINCSQMCEAYGILGYLQSTLADAYAAAGGRLRPQGAENRLGNCALILITCFFMQTEEKTICNYLKEERAE